MKITAILSLLLFLAGVSSRSLTPALKAIKQSPMFNSRLESVRKVQEKVVGLDIYYMNMTEFGVLSSAYITQMLNELVLYNLNDCLYYGY